MTTEKLQRSPALIETLYVHMIYMNMPYSKDILGPKFVSRISRNPHQMHHMKTMVLLPLCVII